MCLRGGPGSMMEPGETIIGRGQEGTADSGRWWGAGRIGGDIHGVIVWYVTVTGRYFETILGQGRANTAGKGCW